MKRTIAELAGAGQLATERKRQRRAKVVPEPLPLLRDPEPVAGIALDDTSHLWELE